VGDGSTTTYLTDLNKLVTFSAFITASYGNLILVYNKATFTVGILDDAPTKSTSRGCTIQKTDAYITSPIYVLTGGVANLYSSVINDVSSDLDTMKVAGTGTFVIYNSIIINCGLTNTGSWTLHNVQFQYSSGAYAFDQFPISASLTNIKVSGYSAVIYQSANDLTINNLICNKNTYMVYYPDYTHKNIYFVNAVSDSWVFRFGTGTDGVVYRQYTFDLQALDSDGSNLQSANVTFFNLANAVVFSALTDSGGLIAEQTVSRGYYDQAHGNTLQDYGTFTLNITKAGYDTYCQKGIVLDEAVDWRISLQTHYSEGYDAGYLDGNASGYALGYSAGYGDGYAVGYGEGYDAGYDGGYDAGWIVGNSTGYDFGWMDGNSTGYALGYSAGYGDGYNSVILTGNAVPGDVASGKTFYNDNPEDKLTGTFIYTYATNGSVFGAIMIAVLILAPLIIIFASRRRD
jgi:hypothetical protein